MSNARLSTLIGQDVIDRTGGDDLARPQDQGVREAGRDLLDVVGDQDDRRGPVGSGEPREIAQQRLPGAEVEAGGRLVEQQQVGIGHQRAGDRRPAPLARLTTSRIG